MPRRCELGCSHNPGVTQHQFPHPEKNPELFKAWVNIVGGKLETADDIKFYRKRVICDIHFADKFKNRNNRLNNIAVPTLHLQGAPSQDAHMPPATPHIPTELPMPEHNIWNLPSTSKQIVTGAPSQDAHMPPATPHIPTELPMPEHNIWDLPSTSKQIITAAPPNACVIAAEHNYCSKHGIQQRRKLKGDKKKLKSTSSLENELKISRFQMKNLKTEIIRLRKRSSSLKERLASVDKISNTNCLKKNNEKYDNCSKNIHKHAVHPNSQESSWAEVYFKGKSFVSLHVQKESQELYSFI
ncbi:uncharacterized protein LOC124629691 [Helicoverpa zea]|uniref:uncharacterized protein LOC124629691 n=1 Tax=Helicoverpa zea TaxID=7113 RepID=UPI001F59A31A|nr:uncharacterized protein LOC124629691 [Helicoverpa zea]